MTELTDLRTDAGDTRTVAVESEDADAVIAAVRDLGLADLTNTSFPRGLKALAGPASSRYAVIDVGTNSVKFHIGERAGRRLVAHRRRPRRGDPPGRGARRQWPPRARADPADGRRDRRRWSRRRSGTASRGSPPSAPPGMRTASNSSELIDAVRERTGIEIEVIPGEEEARLAYPRGARRPSARPAARSSSSTRAAAARSSPSATTTGVDERFSVNVGAVRFTERYGLDGAVGRGRRRPGACAGIAADLALDGRPPGSRWSGWAARSPTSRP